MEFWLWVLVGILVLAILLLCIKVYQMHKATREIEEAIANQLTTDTNVLISISCNDKYMCHLASRLNTQLRQMRNERRRFQQGDLELKEAITNISHDLRTPLTAICGYLDLLNQEELPEKVHQYIDVICNRTEVLKQLTNELFRYTIVTSAINPTQYEEVDLNSVLEECISGFYGVLKGRDIVPEISIPDERVRRKLNKNALTRIFENILHNAIKYTDGDLDIQLTGNGEIIFSNHASGLDEIQVLQLFNRFYTVETAKNSTGLGLSIVKILTEQMKGKIEVSYKEEVLQILLSFNS